MATPTNSVILLKEDIYPNYQTGQKWDLAVPFEGVKVNAQNAFLLGINNLPPETARALGWVVEAAGPEGVYAFNALTDLPPAIVTTQYLACEIKDNIVRWWKDEISGSRCVANIMNCGVSVAAGLAGGIGGEIVGASIGDDYGPIGRVFWGVLGSIFGSFIGSAGAYILSNRLTQWFFGIPKSEALENAYRFLDVAASDSNSTINSRYRRLALKYHPDKKGDPEMWTKLHYSISIIRKAREV